MSSLTRSSAALDSAEEEAKSGADATGFDFV